MTNEQAFEEFKFATNQWFRHMDGSTRCKAVQFATEALQLPVGEVLHKSVMVEKPVPQGRGAHLGALFAGKVWMLNRLTGERVRIFPSEIADFIDRGFERGGPRSK